jgi:hypothetical protein
VPGSGGSLAHHFGGSSRFAFGSSRFEPVRVKTVRAGSNGGSNRAPKTPLQATKTARNPAAMLTLHSVEPAPPNITDRAVQVLASALDDPDAAARVAAAIALLAVARQLPVQLLAIEAGGVSAEVNADTEPPAWPAD